MAALLSVATAVPPNEYPQSEVQRVAREAFSPRYSNYHLIEPVFVNTGIETRYGARPLDWHIEARGWPERTEVYLQAGVDLFIDAATKALAQANVDARDVDAIVTVSSTGIATPSLEARAMKKMGFRANVRRTPVFGLGCAGGVTGLATAARLADAREGATVLLVAVELCTLAGRRDELTKANIVATALFGDGAAACVLRGGRGGLGTITRSAEHTWPDTLDIMGWNVDPIGFSVIFDRSIPDFMLARLEPALRAVLDDMGLAADEVDRFICHPGGTKVLSSLETVLKLPEGTLDHERRVLSKYGNMSAPTVLFVLASVAREGLPARAVLTALGPGFTFSALAIEQAA